MFQSDRKPSGLTARILDVPSNRDLEIPSTNGSNQTTTSRWKVSEWSGRPAGSAADDRNRHNEAPGPQAFSSVANTRQSVTTVIMS